MCNEITAYTESLKRFLDGDPANMALVSGAKLDTQREQLELTYFGRLYTITLTDGKISSAGLTEIPFNDRTLILQYLSLTSGVHTRGRWQSFLQLPGGMLHYAPFQDIALKPLAKAFNGKVTLLGGAAEPLGGTTVAMGDAAVQVAALPKVPLLAVLWDGDDEFPASAQILFDELASDHLSTAALWVLGCEFAKRLMAAVAT